MRLHTHGVGKKVKNSRSQVVIGESLGPGIGESKRTGIQVRPKESEKSESLENFENFSTPLRRGQRKDGIRFLI